MIFAEVSWHTRQTIARQQQILAVYRREQSTTKAASILGVTPPTVAKYVKRAGKDVQSRGGANHTQRKPRCVDYQGQTYHYQDLATQTGIPAGVLYKRLFVYGWTVDRAVTQAVRPQRRA